MRLLTAALSLAVTACTFQGGGIAPFEPAYTHVAERDLDVPYVPTPRRVVQGMLDIAEVGPEDYLIDLGSGDGRIAIMAAERGARALGVDIDPVRVSEATLAAQVARVESLARFRRQDLFETPLREASVVTMYLLPDVNMRLRPRLLTELRPGTRIVSHNFTLGDWQPDAQLEIDASRIYFWIVPAVAAGEWIVEMPGGTRPHLSLEQTFQQVSGTLDGHVLRDVTLRGRQLQFTADLPAGARTFRAIVEDDAIVADTGGTAGGTSAWRAQRAN